MGLKKPTADGKQTADGERYGYEWLEVDTILGKDTTMALCQQDLNATHLRGKAGSCKTKSATVGQKIPVTVDTDAQEEHLWDCAIANSIDAIRDLADKALADRRAGRTKKISL